MGYGKVSIDEINQFQGDVAGVEKRLLFVGNAPSNQNTWQSLNTQTDFDAVFGAAASSLKTQLLAARANGGPEWRAYAIAKADATTWIAAVTAALAVLDAYIDAEGLVICEPADAAGLEQINLGITAYLAPIGMYPFCLAAVAGIDAETHDWNDYEIAMAALVDGLALKPIVPVPLLHGNNIGVLAGRLCRHDVSVADSPMRVATGPVIGLGEFPVDSAGQVLPGHIMNNLSELRLSVPQTYIGFEGIYWSDASTLDVAGSDYSVLENLRVVRKAQRAVRRLQITRVADRKLNNTPASIASNKNYFMRPLRDMAKGFTFAGVTFPGDIKPPGDDAIEIVWNSHTQVDIWLKITPYESPKDLRAHILLDLSLNQISLT